MKAESEKGMCKEIWVTFWKGHILSVSPTEDFYPGDALAGASVSYLKSGHELDPDHLCQVSTPSMTAQTRAQLLIPTLMLCTLFFFLK